MGSLARYILGRGTGGRGGYSGVYLCKEFFFLNGRMLD